MAARRKWGRGVAPYDGDGAARPWKSLKHKATGPQRNPGMKKGAKPKRAPPCPLALCVCGHARREHRADRKGCCTSPHPHVLHSTCNCVRFVLAKPKKPAAKKARALARFGSTEPLDASMLAVSKLPPVFKQGPCPLPPHRPVTPAAEPCSVCGTDDYHRMCADCGRSYDKLVRSDDGTTQSILRWAANRARKAERARNRSKP